MAGEVPEPVEVNVGDALASIAGDRLVAIEQRDEFRTTIDEMRETAAKLKGRKVSITGTVTLGKAGRWGIVYYPSDGETAEVSGLTATIDESGVANPEIGTRFTGEDPQNLDYGPFLEVTVKTTKGKEPLLVSQKVGGAVISPIENEILKPAGEEPVEGTGDILAAFATNQTTVREKRAEFHSTIAGMRETAAKLHGKKVSITGEIDRHSQVSLNKISGNVSDNRVSGVIAVVDRASIAEGTMAEQYPGEYPDDGPYLDVIAVTAGNIYVSADQRENRAVISPAE